jgi:hypothetical protein
MEGIPEMPKNTPDTKNRYSPFGLVHAINQQFAARPTLRTVAKQTLQRLLSERCPELDVDVDVDLLLIIDLSQKSPDENSRRIPLLDELLEVFAQGRLATYPQTRYLLAQMPSARSTVVPNIPTDTIADIINSACETMIGDLQQALMSFWQEPASTGKSRWLWLADVLKDNLSSNALNSSNPWRLDEELRATLLQVVACPDRTQRQAHYGQDHARACIIEVTLDAAHHQLSMPYPALLITRTMIDHELILLYEPSGKILIFQTLEGLATEIGQKLNRRWVLDGLQWQRLEPDGNIFDCLTQVLFEDCLNQLNNVQLPVDQMFDTVEQQFAHLTDLSVDFDLGLAQDNSALVRIQETMPDWLQDASDSDRFTYRQYLTTLAATHQENKGQSFFQDIEPIRQFTERVLQERIRHDHHDTAASYIAPADIELKIAVAHGVPGGWGWIEPVYLNLIDFALENLIGLPGGKITVRSQTGRALPDWLDGDYLKELVQNVDIGKTYPETLRRHLIDNKMEVQARTKIYACQLRTQLPMLALENKIRRTCGFTESGFRYVAAVMSNHPDDPVAGQVIVIKSLTLYGGVVPNMFVIGSRDSEAGPHILYRPLYPESLIEYPSLAALQEAITQSGEVRDSIDTWYESIFVSGPIESYLTNVPIFAGSGLITGYMKYKSLDLVPSEELRGDIFQALFAANSQALVELATVTAVSNADSRWALFKKGGWLIFESILPLLTGPAAVAGWLIQFTVSLNDDLRALQDKRVTDKSVAVIDLLLNIGMVLLHSPRLSKLSVKGEEPAEIPVQDVQEKLAAEQLVIEETDAAPPGTPVHFDSALTDFSWSTPRQKLSPGQIRWLDNFKVEMPKELETPVIQGRYRGLYRYQNRWHALIDGRLFRASIEEGVEMVIHPIDTGVPGPFIRRDGTGQWSIDTRLRLRAGVRQGKRAAGTPDDGASPPAKKTAGPLRHYDPFPAVTEKELAPSDWPEHMYHYVNKEKLGRFRAEGGALLDNSTNNAFGKPQRGYAGLYVTDLAPDAMPLQKLSETIYGKNPYNVTSRATKIQACLKLSPGKNAGALKLYKLESSKLSDHIYVLRGNPGDMSLRIKASLFGTGITILDDLIEF